MPIPTPDQVDASIGLMNRLRQEMDIGIGISLIPRTTSVQGGLVSAMAQQIGLSLVNGEYVWLLPGARSELLSLSSLDNYGFGKVQSHSGLSVGFHLPTSPNPTASFEGIILVAQELSSNLDLVPLLEGEHLVTPSLCDQIRQQVKAIDADLTKAGFQPGSAQATVLFQ